MKKTTTFLLFFAIVNCTFSQTQNFEEKAWHYKNYTPSGGGKRIVENSSIGWSPFAYYDYYGNIYYGVYPNGMYYHTVTDYDRNGNPVFQCRAVSSYGYGYDDILVFNGTANWYYSNGKTKETGTFDMGKAVGKFVEYYQSGVEMKRRYYNNGTLIEHTSNPSNVNYFVTG